MRSATRSLVRQELGGRLTRAMTSKHNFTLCNRSHNRLSHTRFDSCRDQDLCSSARHSGPKTTISWRLSFSHAYGALIMGGELEVPAASAWGGFLTQVNRY